MPGVDDPRCVQSVARLPVAAALDQQQPAGQPGAGEAGRDLHRPVQLGQGGVRTSGGAPGVDQPEARLQVVGLLLDRRREVLDGLRVPAVHARQGPQAGVRPRLGGVEAHGRRELFGRAVRVAGGEERGPELLAQGRVVRRLGDSRAEELDRLGRPSVPQRRHAARLPGARAPQQALVRPHQRVRRLRRVAAALVQVRLRPLGIPGFAVRRRQVVVDVPGRRPDRERPLQVLDGPRRVASGQGRAADARQRRGGRRVDRQRLLEQRLGVLRAAVVEVQLAEVDERGKVGGGEIDGALEALDRPRLVAGRPVEPGEVVGPAHLPRRERLRVRERGLRRLVEAGGHQDQAQLAVGGGPRGGGSAGLLGAPPGVAALPDLRPDRFRKPGEVGHDERRRGGRAGRGGGRGRRGVAGGRAAAGEGEDHRGGQRERRARVPARPARHRLGCRSRSRGCCVSARAPARPARHRRRPPHRDAAGGRPVGLRRAHGGHRRRLPAAPASPGERIRHRGRPVPCVRVV